MKDDIRKSVRNTYAAAAFAEAGEHATAMQMAGIRRESTSVFQRAVKWFDRQMSAVAFAEAGCFDQATELLGAEQSPRRPKRDTLNDFLETVGLGKANVRYGLATVDI